MTIRIRDMKGMSPELADKMAKQGIANSEHLVTKARTAADRKALADSLNVSAKEILALANRADLARIKGIGSVYSDMLEKAGVDTVKELATRKPENLHAKITEAMAGLPQISKPSLQKVEQWISEAKSIGAGLEY